jgi:hypothetical protein
MSIFSSRITRIVELPFDVPNTVTLRALAGRHLERARVESQAASVSFIQKMGGPAFQKELATLGDPEKQKELTEKAKADPLNLFDRYIVLYRGIVGWTYPESLKAVMVEEDGRQVEHIEAIDDLSDEAAEFIAREILRLSKPSLFETKAEIEEVRGNASS